MKDLPIRNIFLPAALVGASIFSSLAFALPTVVNQSATDGAQGAASWRSRHALTGLHKEVVTTYVGTAIVLSAGAGLGTAELLRRRTSAAPKPLDFKLALAGFVDQQAQQESLDMEMQFSSLVAAYVTPDDASVVADEVANEPTNAPAQVRWPSVVTEDAAAAAPVATAESEDTVTIFPGQYQRCRIQVPGSSQPQSAIAFNEQFYSLLSSDLSKEQALTIVQQLEQEQRTAILTRMNQGYAVWGIEPAAKWVSVA